MDKDYLLWDIDYVNDLILNHYKTPEIKLQIIKYYDLYFKQNSIIRKSNLKQLLDKHNKSLYRDYCGDEFLLIMNDFLFKIKNTIGNDRTLTEIMVLIEYLPVKDQFKELKRQPMLYINYILKNKHSTLIKAKNQELDFEELRDHFKELITSQEDRKLVMQSHMFYNVFNYLSQGELLNYQEAFINIKLVYDNVDFYLKETKQFNEKEAIKYIFRNVGPFNQ